MTTAETARSIAGPVNDLGGRFMLDGATYLRGAELGFAGLDFYVCGRAGVLGEVDADTVVAELGFFEPDRVRADWVAGAAVMPPRAAAQEFMACGHAWGRDHLPADLPARRLAELVGRIVDGTGTAGTSTAGLGLFRAWSRVPWPDDDPATALHALHLLRELRGGIHVRAAQEAGLDPHTAVIVRAGEGMAALFGWTAPHPDPEPARAAWDAVEQVTSERAATTLEVLDKAEQAELVDLVRAAL